LVLIQVSVLGPDPQVEQLLPFIFVPRETGKAAYFGILAVSESEAEIVVLHMEDAESPGHSLVVRRVEKHGSDGARKE
jgi:hypothetical protein